MALNVEWVAVDWGTSNVRAWGLDENGAVQFARSSEQGMGRLERSQFPDALSALLGDALPAKVPIDVLICGMAGARQGWAEAPYLEAPADLRTLALKPTVPQGAPSQLRPRILPGVCQKVAGQEDVLRGEETQILGLCTLLPGFAGVCCLPGTHSKWARVGNWHIEQFATAMTGELFELLKTHSVLRHSLAGDLEGPERDVGFEAGLAQGIDAPQALSANLFKVRASALLSGRQPAWCAGYLSGLLIGAEIAAHKAWIGEAPVALIGNPKLCGLYQRGLERLGAQSRLVDATEATLAGLKTARSVSN